jgi:hypothetical protein
MARRRETTKLEIRKLLKHFVNATLLLTALTLIASHAAVAQKTVRLSTTPSAFRVFFKKFTAAVKKGDAPSVASMTNFPFQYGFDAGDEGTWTRAQFLKQHGDIFMPLPRGFKEKDPKFTVDAGSYTLEDSDDASYFTFKKRSGVYKWISYIAEP